jgi:N-formylglutamate amidohydrolase
MILHVPHADATIPRELRSQFILSQSELDAELARSTDWFTDELFSLEGAKTVRFPVSRLVVDPERFEDDNSEPMSAVGRGVIYSCTTQGFPLRRRLAPQERSSILERYYHPHHSRLTIAVRSELEESGSALLVDAHSFPRFPWTVELSPDSQRPDFCIGTDPYHTPAALATLAHQYLSTRGYSVLENDPYSSSLVPMEFYGREPRVSSIMIEVNRSTYMDETNGLRNPEFGGIQSVIAGLLHLLSVFKQSLQ